MSFLWKEGVTLSDIHRRLTAVCGHKAPPGLTMFNWVPKFNSRKAAAQVAVQEWYRNVTKLRFSEAT